MHLTHLKAMRKAILDAQTQHARHLRPVVAMTLGLFMAVLILQALAWLFWDRGASVPVKLAVVLIVLGLYAMLLYGVYLLVKGAYVVAYVARNALSEEPQEPWHIV